MRTNSAKNAFLESIKELCRTLSPEELQKLDRLLTSNKSEIEILRDVIITFPTFKQLYKEHLSQKSL